MKIRAIFLYVAACTIASLSTSQSSINTSNVCTSTECNKLASELSERIDPQAEPCNDFWQFACGGFLKSDSEALSEKYRKMSEKNIRANIAQMIKADVEPSEPRAFKLVKMFYQSCVNTGAIEAKGLEPLREYLRELGGWPVVDGDSWNGEKFDWRRTIYKFRREGKATELYFEDEIGHLIHFEVDISKGSKRITAVQPLTSVIWTNIDVVDFDDDQSFTRIYYESMVKIAKMLGADENRAISELREALLFEIKIAEIRTPFWDLAGQKRDNPMSIAQLNKKYPSVPWMTYIHRFVPSSMNVTDDEIINVPDPDYFVKLEALMANTSKREMRELVHTILGHPASVYADENRTSYCEDLTKGHLWKGVTLMYAKKFLDTDDAVAMTQNIKSQLDRRLRAYNWTDVNVKKAAMEKAATLVVSIGYRASLLNLTKLEESYKNLEFTEDDFFGNIKNVSSYDHALDYKLLNEPFDTDDWNELEDIPIGSTRIRNWRNSITIAQDVFGERYYGKNRPKYMNYGALGHYIGHEMTHALLETGYYHLSDGKRILYRGLRQRPEFEDRSWCLIDQYGNFHVDDKGTKLDGNRTLMENAADVGGVRLAYDAYTKWTRCKQEEPKLPGFEKYSAKQMFWISIGSSECEKIKPEDMQRKVWNYNKHTIYKFRVIGSLANMPEFAEDFHCTAPSLMNPVKRCNVW